MPLLTQQFTAFHLRIKPADLATLIKDQELPTTTIPGKTKPLKKIMPYSLYMWEQKNSKGIFPSFREWLEMIDTDLQAFSDLPPKTPKAQKTA
jgi:hypothetical protein